VAFSRTHPLASCLLRHLASCCCRPRSDAVVVAVLVMSCTVVAVVMVRCKSSHLCSTHACGCVRADVRLVPQAPCRGELPRRVRPPWRVGVRHREGQGRGSLRALCYGAMCSSHPLRSAALLLSATLYTLPSCGSSALQVLLCSSGMLFDYTQKPRFCGLRIPLSQVWLN